MRRSRILVALVGLCLALGADGAARASGSATSEAGAGSTTCPSTSDEQKLAVARAWHEDVINRRSPATLQDILAPEVVHHAAWGYPAVMNRDGVTAMMNDFLRAFPDLRYTMICSWFEATTSCSGIRQWERTRDRWDRLRHRVGEPLGRGSTSSGSTVAALPRSGLRWTRSVAISNSPEPHPGDETALTPHGLDLA